MRTFTLSEQERLNALKPQEEYLAYQKHLKELAEALDVSRTAPIMAPSFTLLAFPILYNQDAEKYKNIPLGKVGTISEAGVLTVIAMDLIMFYGNPKRVTLEELSDIVGKFQYRAYKEKADGSLEGNGIRWTFNDNVLPFFGVGTKMVGSFTPVAENLRKGNPSIAILSNRDEVIIERISSQGFHVIHGNNRKNHSFTEIIPIEEFVDSVKAIWICFPAK